MHADQLNETRLQRDVEAFIELLQVVPEYRPDLSLHMDLRKLRSGIAVNARATWVRPAMRDHGIDELWLMTKAREAGLW